MTVLHSAAVLLLVVTCVAALLAAHRAFAKARQLPVDIQLHIQDMVRERVAAIDDVVVLVAARGWVGEVVKNETARASRAARFARREGGHYAHLSDAPRASPWTRARQPSPSALNASAACFR